SSALASKATGYPLAHIAAKLALGYSLPELKNAVTKNTTACFEPALDYLALKIPRWDLNKFRKVSREITSEMKSVGEVMALGRNFEECLQKGLRMLQIGLVGLTGNEALGIKAEKLGHEIAVPTPKRILAVVEALQKGWSSEKINRLSGIDKWFLDKIKNVVKTDALVKKAGAKIDSELMLKAKKQGFSDYQIGHLIGKSEPDMRKLRQKMGVLPSIKQVDTMAAEWPANTNYLYVTYHGVSLSQNSLYYCARNASRPSADGSKNDTKKSSKKKVIVLGSGPYCIGSSVEFDWCCVNAVQTLEKEGYETIMINYNPETVSTDYDICDKLYFDELSLERVLDIYDFEKPNGVVISTGGQIPNNLAMKLYKNNVKILGTSPVDIDRAENRHKFSGLMDKIGVVQPKWKDFSNVEDAYRFAREVEYPVLVRPSYVLSGAAMNVAQNEEDLRAYLSTAAKISVDAPVVISKFEKGAKEIEVDAVATKGEVIIWAIAEHVENAGVHSGDATIVLPPQKLYLETIKRVRQITKQIARELHITGPFNIQFLAKSNEIKVIECNLRASRSFPFSSKVTGYNFIEIATRAMLGRSAKALKKGHYRTLDLDHVGVKVPQFSFSRLKGADPVSGVEMASTGEVACFGADIEEAFLKAMISVGFEMPKKNILLSIGRPQDKMEFLSSAKRFKDMGFTLFATDGTGHFLKEHGIEAHILHKIGDGRSPNLDEYLRDKCIDLVINIPTNYSKEEMTAGYHIRRRTIDLNIPLITNLQVARLMARTLQKYKVEDLKVKSWEEEIGPRT
ncbi:MAG: carbamoyl-phosphate synthase large subunit, partial [Candidatus Gracilibacteria bacterium]